MATRSRWPTRRPARPRRPPPAAAPVAALRPLLHLTLARAGRLIALVLAVAASAACSGGDGDDVEDESRPPVDIETALSCLREAGTRILRQAPPQEELGAEGALAARHRGTQFEIFFEPDARTARSSEEAVAGLSQGSWVKGVPLGRLLKRSGNAVLVYSRPPRTGTARAVERCVGGPARLDESVARRYDE